MGQRHALVTGGGRGIGRAIARALSAGGFAVTVLGRTAQTLSEAVMAGDAAHAGVCDVTDGASLRTALSDAERQAGPVAVLVNNAGGADSKPFSRTSAGDFEKAFALNVTSAVNLARLVVPGMVERRDGRIINVASTAGLVGYGYVTAYCAAKHAIVGFTRSLAVELAKTGVTVNAVCPGYTETDMVQASVDAIVAKTGRSETEARAALLTRNPAGRFIRPEEVAAAVLWLASEGAASVTGQAIAIDGGETAA